MIGGITIHAGPFCLDITHYFVKGVLKLCTKKRQWFPEKIKATELKSIDIASEDNVKKLGGTVGWGLAGAVMLGPVGLLAGLICGGKKKEITFVAEFKDGRKMLATCSNKTYSQIQASLF
jgi:hypothetical protein